MLVECTNSLVYHGFIKSFLLAGLAEETVVGLNLEELSERCQNIISRYFDEYEKRESIVLNLEPSPIEGEVRIFLHDRPITGCVCSSIDRSVMASLVEHLTEVLSSLATA